MTIGTPLCPRRDVPSGEASTRAHRGDVDDRWLDLSSSCSRALTRATLTRPRRVALRGGLVEISTLPRALLARYMALSASPMGVGVARGSDGMPMLT